MLSTSVHGAEGFLCWTCGYFLKKKTKKKIFIPTGSSDSFIVEGWLSVGQLIYAWFLPGNLIKVSSWEMGQWKCSNVIVQILASCNLYYILSRSQLPTWYLSIELTYSNKARATMKYAVNTIMNKLILSRFGCNLLWEGWVQNCVVVSRQEHVYKSSTHINSKQITSSSWLNYVSSCWSFLVD